MSALRQLQDLVLAACLRTDPAGWLQQQLDAGALAAAPAERALLAGLVAQADGLRLTRLLVQKLRLERLLRGDAAAARAFASDAAAFVPRFRRYCEQVPPTAVFPSEEAALFAAFLADEQRGAAADRGGPGALPGTIA